MTCYYLTGLSGAGKTTIGKELYFQLKAHQDNIVYLDGDTLREVFGGQHGHSVEDRKNLAMHYSRLCKMLTDQGIDVVITTISMFTEVRNWNRANIKGYTEIYLKVPMDILIQRDQKQLYSRAIQGEVENVMGVDVEIDAPESPDIILQNDGSKTPAEMTATLKAQISTSA